MIATIPEARIIASPFDIDAAIEQIKAQIQEINPDQYIGSSGGKNSKAYKSAIAKVSTLRKNCEILASMKTMPLGTYASHPDYGLGEIKYHELDDRGVPMTFVAFDNFELEKPVPTGKLSIPELQPMEVMRVALSPASPTAEELEETSDEDREPETLTERVHALLRLEKRSLNSIAEEVGEDLAEVAKALHKLNGVGRALRIKGSFWSLPDLIGGLSSEAATEVVWKYLERFQTGRERCEAVALTHDTAASEHVHAAAALLSETERDTSLPSIRKVFLHLYYSDDVQEFLEGLPQFKTGSKVRWIKDKVENPVARVVSVSGCAIKTDASPMFFLSSCFEPATEGGTRLEWKVGSRVESQMTGSTGELTRNLKTKVSIWWDKDKNMGLKPMDYSEEDLEVMRVVLLPKDDAGTRGRGDAEREVSQTPSELSPCLPTSAEQPSFSGNQQPLTEWQAYGYAWTFDPANKVIECSELYWELEKFSLHFDDFAGNNDCTQIDPNQSPQSWLDEWMVAYRDRFENVLVCNEKFEEPSLDSYPKELWLNPDDVILDAGTQSRLKEDEERIADYKRMMDEGEWEYSRRPLPQIAISDGRYYAIDCHHRVPAGRRSPNCSKMLFEVHKATLAQARLWSARANTEHGLAADNSPSGVRKRIEMFLDNLELLTPEQYQAEFEKVPDLTPTEKKIGKFSDRTIARYLRLRPNQYKTVQNIRREREFAGKFSQMGLEEGISRVEVVGVNSDQPIGSMGLVMQLDRKSGVWVKWDGEGIAWAIHPDLVVKTQKPKPLTVAAPQREAPQKPPSGIAECFDPPDKTDSVLPDLTPETPDKASPEVVTPYQEQTSTTPEIYAKGEVEVAALALIRLTPEQLHEVPYKLTSMGANEEQLLAIAHAIQFILNPGEEQRQSA